MASNEDNIFKILLVGEGGVGKTSLTKQFVYQRFDEKYLKTLGTNISKKDVVLDPGLGGHPVHLQLWDVLGQKGFQAIIKSAFKGARGVIFVCDLTDISSLQKLQNWINYAYEYGPRASFIFLGNKSDLPNQQFGMSELEAIAKPFNASAQLTSAKNGDQVEDAFIRIASSIYQKKYAPEKCDVALGAMEEVCATDSITAEDKIIAAFCQHAGGFQVSMPIVRQHFQ